MGSPYIPQQHWPLAGGPWDLKNAPPKDIRHLIPQANKDRHHWSQWRFLARYLKDQSPYKFYRKIPYSEFECITDMNKYMKEEFCNGQDRNCFLKKLTVILDQMAARKQGDATTV